MYLGVWLAQHVFEKKNDRFGEFKFWGDFFSLKPRKINIIPYAPDELRLNRYYIVLVSSSSFYMKFVLLRETLHMKRIL